MELDVPSDERGVPGPDGSVDELFGRLRAYLPLWVAGHARHVLALQVAGAGAYGPQAEFGRFGVGGASGSPEEVTGFTLFGGEPVPLPVRGYAVTSRFGRWAWSASAEYRFPLLLVNRGLGAWPVHLDRVVGSLFADFGDAGMGDSFVDFLGSGRDPLASVGAELSIQFLGGYDAPLLLRSGVALPLVDGDGTSVYVRVGLPF
jgi:outer membrane protein assembly factor BamA